MEIPQLFGNDVYKTNFITVRDYQGKKQNGLTYGTPYLWVECSKATIYTSGALFSKDNNENWILKQIDMSVDDPETIELENTIRFELKQPDGSPFPKGEYKLRVVADGRQSWTDYFIIA